MQDDVKKLKTMIEEMVKDALKEISATGSGEGYLTPKAFGSPKKKTTEVLGLKTVKKDTPEDETTVKEEDALPFITRHFEPITEGVETTEVPEKELTPRQKIYQMTRQAKQSVDGIELLLDKMLALKKEENVNSDDYYKRTHKALSVMNEKIKRCILKMNSMK